LDLAEFPVSQRHQRTEAQSTQLHPPKQRRRFIITDIAITDIAITDMAIMDIGITDIAIAGGVMAIASAAGKCYYVETAVFGACFDGPNRLAAIATD
jgi:hypothetical protein